MGEEGAWGGCGWWQEVNPEFLEAVPGDCPLREREFFSRVVGFNCVLQGPQASEERTLGLG